MFVDSFWSQDYAAGLNALYGKLEQGVVENNEMLALARARADAEESYGVQLADVGNRTPRPTGFGRDDGASMRQAYVGVVGEMAKEGRHHLQVSQNIHTLVLEPFSRWAEEHERRIAYSKNATLSKVKEYESNLNAVNKAQKRYFNKCRLLEEQRELDDSDEAPEAEAESAEGSAPTSQELTLNGRLYTDKQVQDLISKMLKEIPRADHKVPILGTYENCTSGSDLVQWVQTHLAGDLQQAERVGQQLVDEGILRSVGQVGSRFANSSVLKYQWRPRAFELAGLAFNNTVVTSIMGTSLGESLGERWHEYYQGDRDIAAEVRDLDQKYRKAVVILDNTRSQLEELVVDHLRFLEKCELDRLKALKAVGLDLVAAQSNVVPSIQASVDKQLLYQESMNPATDLRYIIEQYQTGPMLSHVTIYDNYYSSSDGTVFGMDLELRARGDGKPVPFIVSTLLAQMDKLYPRLESDEVRLKLWTDPAPLKDINALRRELNFNATFDRALLEDVGPATIVGTLLLYLFQLPDSVLPSQHYDILKAIYTGSSKPSSDAERLQALRTVLKQLRVSNLATLDVLCAHLNRLVSIAKPSQETLAALCKVVGSRLLRPKQYTAHTIGDNFVADIVRDLVTNRDIFKELRSERSSADERRSSDPRRTATPTQAQQAGAPTLPRAKPAREPVEARISRIASRKVSRAEPKAKPDLQLSTPAAATADAPRAETPRTSGTSTPTDLSSIKDRLDELALEAESFQDAPDTDGNGAGAQA